MGLLYLIHGVHKHPSCTRLQNYDGHYKSNIRFHRGESLERFGVKVNGYTNTDLSDEDFNIITNATNGSMTKEQCYGLTLTIYYCLESPKLGSMGCKKVSSIQLFFLDREDWSDNLTMLQYEALKR